MSATMFLKESWLSARSFMALVRSARVMLDISVSGESASIWSDLALDLVSDL